MEILYHDPHIAVVVKPAGFLCEENGNNNLPNLIKAELEADTGKPITPFCVHRLDRETSGIMVYALTQSAAAALSAQIQSGKFKKTYTALLCGVPDAPNGSLYNLLYYDRQRSKSFVVDRERKGVKDAKLCYKVLKSQNALSLVEIELMSGRTHQIRVQFSSRKLPLCGDRKYGAPAAYGNSLALCATSLSFFHPKSHKPLSFSIPHPAFFEDLLNTQTDI